MTPEQGKLGAFIDEVGLGAAKDFLLASAVTRHLILNDGAAPDAPLGTTRFGGVPDLAEGVSWPQAVDGRLATFYAQLDFADLAQRIAAPELPRQGLLSLFLTSIETGLELIGVKALLCPPGTRLVRAAVPERSLLVAPEIAAPKPIHVRFARHYSLPYHSRAFRRALKALVPEDDDAFAAFMDGILLRQRGEVGQLLGFAGDPLYHEAHDYYRRLFFRTTGRSGYEFQDYWESEEEYEAYLARCHDALAARYRKDMDPAVLRWLFTHQRAIEAGAASWRLLLTLHDSSELDFNFGDAGALYFFVPATELARGDFSRMTADQFG